MKSWKALNKYEKNAYVWDVAKEVNTFTGYKHLANNSLPLDNDQMNQINKGDLMIIENDAYTYERPSIKTKNAPNHIVDLYYGYEYDIYDPRDIVVMEFHSDVTGSTLLYICDSETSGFWGKMILITPEGREDDDPYHRAFMRIREL